MSGSIPRRRTRAREIALQFLYQVDLRGLPPTGAEVRDELDAFFGAAAAFDTAPDTAPETVPVPPRAAAAHRRDREDDEVIEIPLPREAPDRDESAAHLLHGAGSDVADFARELIEGALRSRERIDELLRRVAKNWDIERMATIDRNVLRLAVHELLDRPDIPPKVTINEAIELAKKYSTANSGGFVNGILDRVRIDFSGGRSASGSDAASSDASTPPPAPADDVADPDAHSPQPGPGPGGATDGPGSPGEHD